ncbi:MAG: S9 family peptidase [Bdellovibrionales bacterium]|nr:S9 family peptidase [Bdellovibrionales bacterium]
MPIAEKLMIEKYLNAFPYTQTYISRESKYLFFLKELKNSKILYKLDLEQSDSYDDAVEICSEDFSKRSYMPIFFCSKVNFLYFQSDENNKENFNMYSLKIETGEIEQITHCTYCGVYGFSADRMLLVYGDRYKTSQGRFYTKLYLKDLNTGDSQFLIDDINWKYKLSWSDVKFDLKKENIFFMVDRDNLRKKYNIVQINLTSKSCVKLLPEDQECCSLYFACKFIAFNKLFFFSEVNKHKNLYVLNLDTNKIDQISFFVNEISDYLVSKDNKTLYVTVVNYKKNETYLNKIMLMGEKRFDSVKHVLSGTHFFADSEDLWLGSSSLDQPHMFTKYRLDQELVKEKKLCPYIGSKEALVHNAYKYLEYSSFDSKKVPAYLSLPKGDIKGAVITAFYGGNNDYNFQTQIFSELGIAVLSPAVRGSFNHGTDWRDMIKGDLGGNEILDLQWGAKYLEKELGLSSNKIGVKGRSHGGYAVLRSLTMPKNFKSMTNSFYPYGFGICLSGFADLIDFYKTSNIPDWLVSMLGQYDLAEEKYKDRSPLYFFNNLKAPLFIFHGKNDRRVPLSSMEGFLNKLRNSNKDYTINILKEAGHGPSNKKEEIIKYIKIIKFLKKVLN